MSIYNKLFEIQQKLKAPKGQYNKFGNYAFRSCEDILEAVKPLLMEQKAIVTISDELVLIGQRYYIKATASLMDIETGEQVKNEAYAREDENKKGMDLSQITGASSSYARKYALNGLFCIDDNKDSDTTNTSEKEEKQEKQVSQTNTTTKRKKPCCENCGKEFEGFKTDSGKQYSAELEYNKRKERFGQALCDDCARKRGLK